jgi:hypothetical protein
VDDNTKIGNRFILCHKVKRKGSAKSKAAALLEQSRVEQEAQFEAFKAMLVGESMPDSRGSVAVGNVSGAYVEISPNEVRELTAEVAFDLICHDASALCHALEFIDSMGACMNENQPVGVEEVAGNI